MTHPRSFLLLVCLLPACAADIAPDDPSTDPLPLGDDEELLDDGSIRVTVDATSETDWVGYAFGSGTLGPGIPGDLDIQRYRLRLGSGIEAAMVDASWDEVVDAPADGYTTDTLPLEEDESYVFNAWYTYDPTTHTLASTEVVFVLDDGDDLQVKVQVESYYDDAGTPGFLTFRWAELGGTR